MCVDDQKDDEKEEKIADMVDGGDDPYEQLKSRLFSLIVEHRIYREEHLLQLFDKVNFIITLPFFYPLL
jgi:hypothetical protein